MSESMVVVNPETSLGLQKVGVGLFKSGLFPNAKNEYGAFAIIEYGHEIGIPPMMALKNINIISGQLACNGQLMLALALAKGVKYEVQSETETGCSILFTREGHKPYTATFTQKDAEAAGLANKENWKKYPKDMYYWRTVAKGIRRIAPDAVMGLYTVDEITEGKFTEVQDVPIDVTPEPPPNPPQAPTPTPTESSKEMLMRELDSYCTDAEGQFNVDMCNAILAEIAETKSGPLTWDKLCKLDAVKWEKWIGGILEKYRNRG
jgi:hypothetical protein